MNHSRHQRVSRADLRALMKSAADYAASAMDQLIGRAADQPEALERINRHYVDLAFALELEFTFPGLTREQRDILVSLMKVRNGLLVQFGGLKQWRTQSDQESHTEVVRNLKVDFLRLKTQLERLEVVKQLDPLQQCILREELLSLPPDKTESTTFFVRRPANDGPSTPPPGRPPDDPQRASPQPPLHKPQSSKRASQSRLVEEFSSASPAQSKDVRLARLGSSDKRLLFITAEPDEYREAIGRVAEAGYGVQIARDLRSALEEAIDHPPILVILDLDLPKSQSSAGADETDASRVLKGLTLLGDHEQPVVVGVSGSRSAQPAEPGVAYPLATVLHKPIDASRLLGAVYVALDDTRLQAGRAIDTPSTKVLVS